MNARSNRRDARKALAAPGVSLAKATDSPTTMSTTTEPPAPAAEPVADLDNLPTETLPVVAEQPVAAAEGETVVTAETAEAEQPVADPFADLPMVEIAGHEVRDLTKATKVADPRKYAGVHKTALDEHLQVKKGWRYANKIFALGTGGRRERKPTTVHGMVQMLATKAGKAGIPAPVMVAALRQGQTGNKRSHFCDGLPPTGWAEGWIDSAVKTNILKVVGEITSERAAGMGEEATEATQTAQAA